MVALTVLSFLVALVDPAVRAIGRRHKEGGPGD